MASKREFTAALDDHIEIVRGQLINIQKATGQNKSRVEALETQRTERIDKYIGEILPNVDDSTLANLERVLPNFLAASAIKRALESERETLSESKQRLLNTFNPATADSQELTYETELEQLASDLELAKGVVRRYESIQDFTALIKRGYNTSDYPHSFWESQYRADWKRGDQIVAEQGCSWNVLSGRYEDAVTNRDNLSREHSEADQNLTQLRQNRATYNDLLSQEVNLPSIVTEKIQIKLKAYVSTLQPLPLGLKDLASFDKQIKDLGVENATVQQDYEKATTQLAELLQLRTKIERSKATTVPDDFLKKIQGATNSYRSSTHSGSRGSRGGTNVIYVHNNDNWLLDAMIYNQMFNHFDDHHSHGSSYGSQDNDPGGRSSVQSDPDPYFGANNQYSS